MKDGAIRTTSETVAFWIADCLKEKRNIPEEIEEVKCAISNEKLWSLGSGSEEEAEQHRQNAAELNEYLDWLKEQEEAA